MREVHCGTCGRVQDLFLQRMAWAERAEARAMGLYDRALRGAAISALLCAVSFVLWVCS
jgi:hypothetical protein